MSGSWQHVLRKYATKPANLPPSVLYGNTEATVTIFDGYPKAIFHFLILPRPSKQLTADDLVDLRTLLRKDKETAHATLNELKEESAKLVDHIQKEMRSRYGFTWDIWTGFHAVPSVPHLHLHVISSDLVSSALKNKKHYNSFHPSLGYFLSLDVVLRWFDDTPEAYKQSSALRKADFEPLLKKDLACFRCDHSFKTIPLLKSHLEDEWNKMRGKSGSKRKAETDGSVNSRPAKKPARDEKVVIDLSDD